MAAPGEPKLAVMKAWPSFFLLFLLSTTLIYSDYSSDNAYQNNVCATGVALKGAHSTTHKIRHTGTFMARILLIDKDCSSRAKYLESLTLPAFYMQDFSIQGITVGDFNTARRLLGQSGYTVLDKNGGADIIFDDVKELGTILSLLRQHGLHSELADIADTLYQA